MALFIRKEEDQSALRTKVTADLQERMKKTARIEGDDLEKSSSALENQHTTRGIGIIITILMLIIIGLVIYLLRP